MLDWELPYLTGLQALPNLLRAVPGATIVVFSADADRATAAIALAGGADRYLVKDANGVADVITVLREYDTPQRLPA